MKPKSKKYFEYSDVFYWLKEESEGAEKELKTLFEEIYQNCYMKNVCLQKGDDDAELSIKTKELLRKLANNKKEINIYFSW